MRNTFPKLNYSYDALEPFIDAKTMEVHHSKHHQTYFNNLVAALEKHPELTLSLEEMLKNPTLIPEDIRQAVINNGGGHHNHTLLWQLLKVNHGQLPKGKLMEAINRDFGSFDEFKTKFDNAAKGQFGSGWAWLLVDKNGKLVVTGSSNQNIPFNLGEPILTIDVWEHAYYLQYQNRRADYVSAYWHVINWDRVEELFNQATK
ncbi:MAG: superoxide dismutase [Acholeplasmataceae bacterium]|jgi:Fe-Mn family superoxide dismutase